MSGPVTLLESQTEAVVNSAPGMVPLLRAITAMITKITMNTTSMARKMRLSSLSEEIPRRFTTVLMATKIRAQIQRADPGKIPIIDSAANT
jgi:hypothetical protein